MCDSSQVANWPEDVVFSSINYYHFTGGTSAEACTDVKELIKNDILRGQSHRHTLIEGVELRHIADKEQQQHRHHHSALALFATRDFSTGVTLGAYTGIVRARPKVSPRPAQVSSSSSSCANLVHIFGQTSPSAAEPDIELDATQLGNETRFIRRASAASAAANVRLVSRTCYCTGTGERALVVVTSRPIMCGDELLLPANAQPAGVSHWSEAVNRDSSSTEGDGGTAVAVAVAGQKRKRQAASGGVVSESTESFEMVDGSRNPYQAHTPTFEIDQLDHVKQTNSSAENVCGGDREPTVLLEDVSTTAPSTCSKPASASTSTSTSTSGSGSGPHIRYRYWLRGRARACRGAGETKRVDDE
jgi:hypothetical protein